MKLGGKRSVRSTRNSGHVKGLRYASQKRRHTRGSWRTLQPTASQACA